MKRIEHLSRSCGVLPALVGLTVVTGGLFFPGALLERLPVLAPVGINTALAMLAAGGTLLLFQQHRIVALRLALLTCLLSLLVLFQNTVSWFPQGQGLCLLCNTVAAPGNWPGRMSPVTAFGLATCGISLFLQLQRYSVAAWVLLVALLFAIVPAALGVTGTASYLLGTVLYSSGGHVPSLMALPTAICLLCLGIGTQGFATFHPRARDWFRDRIDRQVFATASILLFFASHVVSLAMLVLSPSVEQAVTTPILLRYELLEALFLPLLVSVCGALLLAFWVQPLMRELEETRSRLQEVLIHIPDAVVTIDEDGRIESVNGAAERLFGYTRQELLAERVELLMDPFCASQHQQGLQRYLETGESRIMSQGPQEVAGRHRSGRTLELEIAISEYRIGNKRHFIGLLRDISQRKAVAKKTGAGGQGP